MTTLTGIGGQWHDPMPDPTTIRRARDGEPGSMMDAFDYPLVARCICGEPIRIDRKYNAEWRHVPIGP